MSETVTFAELEAALRREDYPLDADDLRAEYGDWLIQLAGGEERVRTVLDRVESDGAFHDPGAVLEEVYGGVSVAGVGRPQYTDRGGSAGSDTAGGRWSF